jgi:hypothetical protein
LGNDLLLERFHQRSPLVDFVQRRADLGVLSLEQFLLLADQRTIVAKHGLLL